MLPDMRAALQWLALCGIALTVAAAGKPIPWLGLSFMWSETGAQTHMLHVRKVAKAGPAERAGIREGDLIARINGERVDFGDELDFLLFLADRSPGERLTLTVIREGRRIPLEIVLGRLADDARPNWERNLEMARRQRGRRAAPPAE